MNGRAVALYHLRLGFGEQLAEERAVTARLVVAVTADREVGLRRQCGEQRDETLRRRCPHLAPIAARVDRPSLWRPLLRVRVAHEGRTRREVGKPEVEVVEATVVGLLDATRRTAHRAEARAFVGRARSAELDYTDGHDRRLRAVGCGHTPSGS